MVRKYPILFRLQDYHVSKIAGRLKMTDHAKQRFKERNTTDLTVEQLLIQDFDFGYVAGDNVINIGLKDGTVFKIAQGNKNYLVITYLEPSMNRISIRQKYSKARRGGNR